MKRTGYGLLGNIHTTAVGESHDYMYFQVKKAWFLEKISLINLLKATNYHTSTSNDTRRRCVGKRGRFINYEYLHQLNPIAVRFLAPGEVS